MADISDKDNRPLPYPLKNTLAPIGYSPNDGASIVPLDGIFPDESTKVQIVLELSSDEYVALASAIDVGRDIAYGEHSELLWWIWVRAFKGLATMSCEDIADCIETSSAVTQALTYNNDQFGTTDPDYLSQAGTESTTIINNRFPPAKRQEEIKTGSCDLDVLWAGIRYMVERIDDNGRQMLERIVTKVDIWQKIIEFTGTVPIVGELGENVLKAFVNSVDDLLNAYNAHSSQGELDNIACDLFEMVCAECRYPTFNELADYYASFGISGVQDWNNIALKAMVDYVTGSNGLAGLVVYFTVNTFQLFVLYAEATFVNARKAKKLALWCDIGEDNPNNGWELLCEDCVTGEFSYIEYDFREEPHGFVAYDFGGGNVLGVWEDGVGWTANGWLQVSKAFAAPKPHVVGYAVEYIRLGNNCGNCQEAFEVFQASNSIAYNQNFLPAKTDPYEFGQRYQTPGGYTTADKFTINLRNGSAVAATAIRARLYFAPDSPVKGTPIDESEIPPSTTGAAFDF